LDEDEINKRFVLYSKDWINECFYGCFMWLYVYLH
jgi:hypothetical protein